MTIITNTVNTRNQSFADYDVSKLLLGDNYFGRNDYTDSGAGSTLAEGLLLGKIAATGKLVPLAPAAADGSQFPIGVLWLGGSVDIDVAISATVELEYANKGKVAEAKLVMPGGVTLDDVIVGDGRTVKDYLNALGIILEGGVELTEFDNS
jgi:hypothetical protein